MLRCSVLLTAVGLVTIVLNLLVSQLITAKRVNITRVQLRDSGKLVFEHKVTANVAANAISRASTRQVVDDIERTQKKPNSSVKKAAAARRTELDEFDAEWEEAKKKQEQSKKAASTI